MHNVWVLPGHIIVSLDEGHKLLAFDLLPKPKPWPDVTDFLNSKQGNKRKGNCSKNLQDRNQCLSRLRLIFLRYILYSSTLV